MEHCTWFQVLSLCHIIYSFVARRWLSRVRRRFAMGSREESWGFRLGIFKVHRQKTCVLRNRESDSRVWMLRTGEHGFSVRTYLFTKLQRHGRRNANPRTLAQNPITKAHLLKAQPLSRRPRHLNLNGQKFVQKAALSKRRRRHRRLPLINLNHNLYI